MSGRIIGAVSWSEKSALLLLGLLSDLRSEFQALNKRWLWDLTFSAPFSARVTRDYYRWLEWLKSCIPWKILSSVGQALSEFVPTGGLGMKLTMNIDADSLYKYVRIV